MLRKVVFSMCAVAVLALVMGTPAFAQTSDWRTFFTFNTPVTLPGLTLPAGTYLFRVADPNSSRSVVQVLSADGRHPYGMFLTIPSTRPQAAETPDIRFAKRLQPSHRPSRPGGIRATRPVSNSCIHRIRSVVWPRARARRPR